MTAVYSIDDATKLDYFDVDQENYLGFNDIPETVQVVYNEEEDALMVTLASI
jgi:hypothetical protein